MKLNLLMDPPQIFLVHTFIKFSFFNSSFEFGTEVFLLILLLFLLWDIYKIMNSTKTITRSLCPGSFVRLKILKKS